MNPFEFVVAVLILIFGFSLIRHRMGIADRSARQAVQGGPRDAENERLHRQVEQLQERIRVLERIVTDRGVETAAQIEALRDREPIPTEGKSNG
jgi:cell division protein FtsB